MSDTLGRTRAWDKSGNPSIPTSIAGDDPIYIEMEIAFGTAMFHDVLVQARKTIGDNKLFFEGDINWLAKSLEEVHDKKDDRLVVGYNDATGSIAHVHDVNTMFVNLKYDDNTGKGCITLHPLFSVPSTSSYVGNQMVYTNPRTNSAVFTMKSMRPITMIRYKSSYDDETILELDSTTFGMDLNDATAQHIVDYIQQKFEFEAPLSRSLHLELNDQVVSLEESLHSLLREWAPQGGTVTVLTRPDLKELVLNMDGCTHKMEIIVRTLTGKRFSIFCFKWTTVGHLKEMIHKREGIPCEQQRLIFDRKQQLEDGLMLGVDCNMKNESIVDLVLRLRGGMYHRTSARQDFRNLDLPDVHNGRPIALICPDGSRTFMYTRPNDSLRDLEHRAVAIVKEAHTRNNDGTDREGEARMNSRDPSLEGSVRQLRSLLFNAKREQKRTENEIEMEKARMNSELNSDEGQRETLVQCVDKIVALRAQLVDQTAQIRLLQEQLIDKEMELEESAQSEQHPEPAINRE